jgi:hypothetical protein
MHQAITAAWRRLRHIFDMSVVNTDNNKREIERERGKEREVNSYQVEQARRD